MSVDLLKLDKDCAMPNLLRAKWKELHGYDPLRVKRRQDFFACTALFSLSGVFLTILAGVDFQSNMLFGMGVILIIPATIFALLYFLFGRQSNKFAVALEELALTLDVPVTLLHRRSWRELEDRAGERMNESVRELLSAEDIYSEAVRNGVSDNERVRCLSQIEFRRIELRKRHKPLSAFQLVSEKWDPYFDAVKAEMSREKSEATETTAGMVTNCSPAAAPTPF